MCYTMSLNLAFHTDFQVTLTQKQQREEIWKAALNVQLLLFHAQRTKGGEVG